MKEKVLIGMSGGVDSSVAAYLLLEQGYDVIGVMMKLWDAVDEREDGCCSLSAAEDARRVCDKLGIPFYVLNFKQVFEKTVIDYFVDEYLSGKTPNPCIACNKYLKFGSLINKAQELEASYVATGHYAKVEYSEVYGRYIIKKSATAAKDQTYVLYNLTQDQLKHILMPLGSYTKDQTREIAKKLGLRVANKPESQEICFIEDNNYGRFINERRADGIKSGYFVNVKGEILGKHKGIIYYTVGQRKGLGIALGKPMYVVEILPEKNLVVLGDENEVFKTELIASQTNFMPFQKLTGKLRVKAKIRYSAKESDAEIWPLGEDSVKVVFKEPQRAITPGQAVVFYEADVLVGGGTIEI